MSSNTKGIVHGDSVEVITLEVHCDHRVLVAVTTNLGVFTSRLVPPGHHSVVASSIKCVRGGVVSNRLNRLVVAL